VLSLDSNGLLALDVAAGVWTCLEKGDPKGAGAGTAFPAAIGHDGLQLVYEAPLDLYRLGQTGLWAYNPNTRGWTKRQAEPAEKFPSGRDGNNGWAYDPDNQRYLSWSGGAAFYTPADNRLEPLPAGPCWRWVGRGLAYDSLHKLFVLHSGCAYIRTPRNDTWTFDPRTKQWRQMRPLTCPPPRRYHCLVWHDKLGALVMAGPSKSADNPQAVDLWVYEADADRWTEVKTPTGPPPPGYYATAYDKANDALVYLVSGQTWVLKIERARQ
jgi:hypothetical protein